VYAVARDITEQKLAEAQLAEAKEREAKLERQLVFADRMASVGTLAAGVAHEINNPLAYVSANISLMLESLHEFGSEVFSPRLPELCAMAVAVQEGAERIRKTVRGLKTFSRAEQERRALERVVFISGGAFSPTATAFLEQAQIQCIEKPFDALSVLRLVRRFAR